MFVPKVHQMQSVKSYNVVPNQFVIETPEGTFFQSYQTIIAFKPNEGLTMLDRDSWDYSRTTGKYRNKFLGENTAETRARIKKGEYVLVDLN